MTKKSLVSKKVIVVVGPTATNKTNVAITLAKELNGEIINADAFQVYQELNIGVNKPTTQELTMAKFHLVGTISINQK
jgi:tRNA dimethylallyltransferase